MSDDDRFEVKVIFGHRTQRGLVEIRCSPEMQVLPAKARELAQMLLECASAAEGDEILMRVLDRAGLSPQRATQVLMAMRLERQIVEAAARREARRALAEDQSDDDHVE